MQFEQHMLNSDKLTSQKNYYNYYTINKETS